MFGQPAAPAFGSPAPAAGGFGAASTFGQAAAPAAPAASPFGSAPAAPAFGAAPAPAAASPFGAAPAPAPGAFSFGSAPAPAPATSAFGGAAPAAGGAFGAAPAPAGGAFAFGAPAPAPAAPAFGSAAASSPFGAAPAPAAASSPFGAAAPAPAGNIFGGAPAAGGGLFGSAPAPAPAAGLFGAAAPAAPSAASPFGAAAPAPAAGGTNLFGAPAPAAPGGGLFGQPAAGAAGQKAGTAAFPYQATMRQDGQTRINIQAITSMQPYENRSFEELRLEDYMAGNRGTQGAAPAPAAGGLFGSTAPAPAAGAFGAPAPAPGAFGAAAGGFSGFGSTATSPAPAPGGLFGSPAPAPLFGSAPAPTAGAFGAPAPAPAGGLFGAAAPAAPAFGTTAFGATATSPAPAPFSFGAQPPAPAPAFGSFGAAAAKPPSTGLFGSAPAPTPAPGTGLFGAPAPAPGGLFGSAAPAPAPGGLFGTAPAPAPGTAFGAAPAAPLFGAAPAAAPTPGGLFGAPQPAPGGLFGAQQPALGAAPAPGGLFGSAPAATGVFGGFGGAAAPPAPTPGGLFGSAPQAPAGGLFGMAAAPAPHAAGNMFGYPATSAGVAVQPVPPSADALLAQKLAAIEAQKNELALLEPWRGTPPSGGTKGITIPSSLSERDAAAYAAGAGVGQNGTYAATPASSALMRGYHHATPRSTVRIRPRGFLGPKTPQTEPVRIGNGSGYTGSPILSPDAYLGSTTKRLVIKPGSLTKNRAYRLQLTNGAGGSTTTPSPGPSSKLSSPPPFESPLVNGRDATTSSADADAAARGGEEARDFSPRGVATPPAMNGVETKTGAAAEIPANNRTHVAPLPPQPDASNTGTTPKTPVGVQTPSTPGGDSYELYRRVVASPGSEAGVSSGTKSSRDNNSGTDARSTSLIPDLTKAGYTVSPTLEELSTMSAADLAAVSNFTVSRPGFGSVAWEGAVDVRGVDIDSVVVIEDKEVRVYDDYETDGTKPPVGSKLNRPAVVTLLHVFPKDGAGASAEDVKKFERRVAKQTKKMGAELISYDVREGIWRFRTLHFSRYAFDDDEDTEEEEEDVVFVDAVERQQQQTTPGNPIHGARGGSGTLALMPGTGNQVVSDTSDFESGERGGRSPGSLHIGKVQGMSTMVKDDSEGVAVRYSARTTRLAAPRWDDDTSDSTFDGREGSGMMSDAEEDSREAAGQTRNQAQILAAADAAYDTLMAETTGFGDEMGGDNILTPGVDDDGSITTDDDRDNISDNNISEYIIPKPVSPSPSSIDDLLVSGASQGICAAIARRCGVASFSSSNFDYGMRMGRSFRVGWHPDGTFIHPGLTRTEKKEISSKRGSSSSLGGSLQSQIPPRHPYGSASNSRLLAQRPAFKEGGDGLLTDASPPSAVRRQLLALLRVHFKHSVRPLQVDDCPMFALPKGLGASGGSKDTYKALCIALEDYEVAARGSDMLGERCDDDDPEVGLVASRAFGLLTVLYGQESDAFDEEKSGRSTLIPVDESGATTYSEEGLLTCTDRRREGVVQWLRDSVSYDIGKEMVAAAENEGDISAAIFAAISGGDMAEACSLATDHGFLRLATLLSSSTTCGEDMREQMRQWRNIGLSPNHLSLALARVYSLLGRDLFREEDLYQNDASTLDWRRRLGLRLWSGHTSVESAVHAYDDDVAAGVAPPPSPRYCSRGGSFVGGPGGGGATEEPKCLLYRLLRLRAGDGGRDGDPGAASAKIICPSGYTASPNDFSLAFHMAATVRALGCSPPLTSIEWSRLKDCYAAQLVCAGLWEWAVYVMLCTDSDAPDASEISGQERAAVIVARQLCMRHYSRSDDDSNEKRSFLEEQVGVPRTWFEEALAMRCGYDGDSFGHVTHLVASSRLDEAAQATEELIVPRPVLVGGESIRNLRETLDVLRDRGLGDAVRWNKENGCAVVLDLLNLADEVTRLAGLPRQDLVGNMEHIAELSHIAGELEGRISDPEGWRGDDYVACQKTAGVRDVERLIGLVEIASSLSLLRLQLNALESGRPILLRLDQFGSMGVPRGAAEMAFVATEQKDFAFNQATLSLNERATARGVADNFTFG